MWCRDQDNSTGYSWNNILAKNKVVAWGTDDIRKKGKSLTFQSWKLLRLVPVPSISSFDFFFFFISAGSLEPEISKTIKCRLRRWILLNNSKTGYRSFFFRILFFLILVNLQHGILLLKFQKCYIFIFLFACNNDSCFKSSNSWLFVCQQLHAPWSFSLSFILFAAQNISVCIKGLYFSLSFHSVFVLFFFFSLLFHFSIDHSSYKLKNKLHIFQFSIHTLKEAFDSPLKLLKPEKYEKNTLGAWNSIKIYLHKVRHLANPC